MTILRPCPRPGCPELVTSGYCDDHRPKRKQNREKRKLYLSGKWRGPGGIRELQLRRQPLCEVNEICTDPTIANHVHHIDGDTANNHEYNLQSCCRACHTWLETQPGGALH